MIRLLMCAALITAAHVQATRAAPAQAPRRDTATRLVVPVRDTARPTAQPLPMIVVEAPSQWPAAAIGVATLLLLGVQLWIMSRQTDILDRQTALSAQQAEWRVVEAVGTFVRLAHDLVGEFQKANLLPGVPIMANYDTHPREMLREASRLFAPLGGTFVVAANVVAMRLDEYFTAVDAYNRDVRGREGAERLTTVFHLREQVGSDLDAANGAIPKANRWTYSDGRDYNFRMLCSPPPGFPEALEIETSTAPPGVDEA